MRNRFLLFALLCFGFSFVLHAQKSISWAPEHLASGSPALFTVEFASPAVAVSGTWFQHPVEFFPAPNKTTWYALAGADVEVAPGTYPFALTATLADGTPVHATRDIPIAQAGYKQIELHVAQKFVTPDPETLKRIAADKEVKDRAFAHSDPLPLWQGEFLAPVKAPPTDSFGTRRLFNGKLASVHRGMDFRAPMRTPVYAANAGKVILARGLFYEGNCVAIDHGQGLMTIYMHLSRIDVKEDESVKTHQLLGMSGSTGRATGPHLHFAVRWEGEYLDPAILLRMKLPER